MPTAIADSPLSINSQPTENVATGDHSTPDLYVRYSSRCPLSNASSLNQRISPGFCHLTGAFRVGKLSASFNAPYLGCDDRTYRNSIKKCSGSLLTETDSELDVTELEQHTIIDHAVQINVIVAHFTSAPSYEQLPHDVPHCSASRQDNQLPHAK
jgi:hypothetical protein